MDVICAGILVADIFAEPIRSLPRPGELGITRGFVMSPGGCAANVAIDLRKMRRSVEVAGRVGDDLFATYVIGELERHGIGTAHVRRSPGKSTSATVILNVTGEDRRFLHCMGANAEIRGEDLETALGAGARLLYVGGFLAMPGLTAAGLRGLMTAAKQRGMMTVLDVAIPGDTPEPLEQIRAALPFTDYFLPNNDEAELLTGENRVERQAESLSRIAPGCTHVITRGADGLHARQGETVLECRAYCIEALDESGAGDAFAAGLIAGILEGWPLERALRLGAAAGASCTRALGCSAGVFTFEEAIEFMAGRDAETRVGVA